ncbi:MAG: rhomboid family intramembrane serine protease [Lysobacteraceae bacterium]|nr:MAG: rhomboid family intramembrane serine protease [Xanthomonadaceae bacterium]
MNGSIVTWGLIAVTVLLSWQAWNQPRLLDRLILWPPAVDRYKQYDRLLSHGFIHADGMHLIFNMITLYAFGQAMEHFFTAKIGMLGYLGFYLSAIVIAILPTYSRHRRDAHYRGLGASGAVSAVLFAYILLSPWSGIYLFLIPIPIPAFVFAVLYIGYSIWMDKRGGDNVNHSAHLWGAGYGVMFMLLLEPSLAGSFLRRLAQPAFG